jgi:polyhydroxyalkanoate synthesis regulator phasin
MGLSQRAVEQLLADEKRAMRIAGAIGRVQRGREAINRGQDELLRAFGFATKSDYRSVGKQVAALKRRVRELEEKLGKLTAQAD